MIFNNFEENLTIQYRKTSLKYFISQFRYIFIENLVRNSKLLYLNNVPLVRNLYLKVKNLWYQGDRYYCPCCERSFRRFLPHGYRNSAMCPICGSLERHRLMVLYLKFKTDFFFKKTKVLHFSPHSTLQRRFLKTANLEYISVDLESNKVMYKMDITNLLFKDNSFDCILCYHILEHIKNDNLALKELFRILKPKGWAIIQTVVNPKFEKTFEDSTIISPKMREQFYGHKNHFRIYGRDYKDKLENVGFKVKIDKFAFKFDFNKVKKFGISRNEAIIYCTKI